MSRKCILYLIYCKTLAEDSDWPRVVTVSIHEPITGALRVFKLTGIDGIFSRDGGMVCLKFQFYRREDSLEKVHWTIHNLCLLSL